MTTFTRKCVSEDYDVFTVPHSRMKQILNEVSKKIEHTDFTNSASFSNLLADLMKTFLELKHHEEIENKYIMKILKQKLHGEALKRLLEHLHAHSHIADILSRVRKTKRQLKSGTNVDLQRKSSKLNAQLRSFFDEYFPHMIEEEQVLQPMLLEFLSPTELRHIRSIVIEHHQTEDDISEKLAKLSTTEAITQDAFIADDDLKLALLPEEVLATIFLYLDPRELCRCAQVCRSWNHATCHGRLWSVIQPSRWAHGDLSFGTSDLASDDCNCDCQPNYDLSTFRESPVQSSSGTSSSDETTSLNDFSDREITDSLVRRETRILHGLSRYVFPKVGNSVKILTLECSKAITNGMLFRLLSQCGNLEYLDVSQTIISDFGLMGLFKHENSNLKYLDVSGCKNVTDKVLVKLSQTMGKLTNSKNCQCQPHELTGESDHGVRLLHTLRLSGCFKITDHGLRALSKYGGLPYLKHLDLSGCVNITTNGIKELVNTCKALKEVFYCDNLDDVSTTSSLGCQNCECSNRVCCRNISADVQMSS